MDGARAFGNGFFRSKEKSLTKSLPAAVQLLVVLFFFERRMSTKVLISQGLGVF
jgi:hypothetical protein